MHRFFVPSQNFLPASPEGRPGGIIISGKNEIHHIRDVLRLNLNDPLIITDEKGNEFLCSVKKLRPRVAVSIVRILTSSVRSRNFFLSVACAIPKKSAMDDIVDKLTQLGVDRIIPLKTRRVVTDLDERKKQLRLSRWLRIAQSSSSQSQRNILPVVEPIKELNEVLRDYANYDLKLIPTLQGERRTLREIFLNSQPKNILVLIGPEGDFTEAEVAHAKKSGCIAVSLGERVLRVETAAVAVTSFIFLYGLH
ncbi:MAG: RsmE family RNA methyltransferase [Deltaproteobacteria bacterium]